MQGWADAAPASSVAWVALAALSALGVTGGHGSRQSCRIGVGGPNVSAGGGGADVICIVTITGNLRQSQHFGGRDCAAGVSGPARVSGPT